MRSSLLKPLCLSTALVALAAGASPLAAQQRPVLQRDSFPLGQGDGVLCQVQDRSVGNPARQSIFDRRWAVVCRDSAQAVATVYAFEDLAGDPLGQIAPHRRSAVECAGQGGDSTGPLACTLAGTQLGWSIHRARRGDTTYVAEGLTAYDSATRLALQSVIDNAIAPGRLDIATTSVGDTAGFARAQAESLELGQALAEGYRRNLGGEYAEAGTYFETLERRVAEAGGDPTRAGINRGEFLVNQALQKSNLSEFAEAERLFIRAGEFTPGDPVAERLQRNFEAIHLLNQGYVADALARLDRPLSAGLVNAVEDGAGLRITIPIAARLNADTGAARLLGFVDELSLTPAERAEIIDAQALQLRGTALRLSGDDSGAQAALTQAYDRAVTVRDGRVVTIVRLRAQILGELGALAERRGDGGAAQEYLRSAVALLETRYPERRAVSGARARLAALLLRQGNTAEASVLYRTVVDGSLGKRDATSGFANQLGPWFAYLAPQVESQPGAADDFFKALQVLLRPGVAETQAILARELSANSDEAAQLFRQSTDLAREIEQARIVTASLGQDQSAAARTRREELAARIEQLETSQTATLASLSHYPQYRAVAPRALGLADFRSALQPGESYARIAMVGRETFMFHADANGARAFRVALPQQELEFLVDLVRSSISSLEGGQYVTRPFDIASAHDLYRALFAPLAPQLAATTHLIFEPDGALLRLPVDLLVTDPGSVEGYAARQAQAGADPYDFTDTAWLARGRMVSTAVSAQAFVDARRAPQSGAGREYLGFGENAPASAEPPVRAVEVSGSEDCGWGLSEWNRPIDARELLVARSIVGEGQSQVVTGAAFSDTAIAARDDLADFRVLHFATHGLVTPPRPSCPARPALLTSFGGPQSDGLLGFEEIFDLDLDADLVILSACDTAGGASIEATRAAGVASGGGTALDGLVRSFVGAGGRAVLASHWPAPDDYRATERLMSEMFRLGRNAPLGEALRGSQLALMADPLTSHPYYWAGFAVIGDAARPLLSGGAQTAQGAGNAAEVVAR